MSSSPAPDSQGDPAEQGAPAGDAAEGRAIVETTECQNCGRVFTGTYCPDCGQ